MRLLEARGRQADLLIAEPATVDHEGGEVPTVRFLLRAGTWRDCRSGAGVGPGVAAAYLTLPGGGAGAPHGADGA